MGKCVRDVLERCHRVGLAVVALTSDMGSGNRSLWRELGVVVGRESRLVNEFPHPSDPTNEIAVIADVPHLAKNLCGHLLRGQTIKLSDHVVKENNLPSGKISLDPVKKLVEDQKGATFKLAPKLRPELLTQSQFDRMKASVGFCSHAHTTNTCLQ